MFTPEMLEQYDAKYPITAKENAHSRFFIESERLTLEAIIAGERELYVQGHFGNRFDFRRVYSIADIRAIIPDCPRPMLIAIKTGLTPDEASHLDEELFERHRANLSMIIPSKDKAIIGIGDYDEHGAECGRLMDFFLPRADDAPPDSLTQLVLDRLDDTGAIDGYTSLMRKAGWTLDDDEQ